MPLKTGPPLSSRAPLICPPVNFNDWAGIRPALPPSEQHKNRGKNGRYRFPGYFFNLICDTSRSFSWQTYFLLPVPDGARQELPQMNAECES
jgi:hypothetical protein